MYEGLIVCAFLAYKIRNRNTLLDIWKYDLPNIIYL